MQSNKAKAVASHLLWAIGLLSVWSNVVTAERLPVKAYTTADGLAQNAVNRIVPDSRGFLWFCTDEGLSRFDGYTFTNYTTADGLPHPFVGSLLETQSGVYWVGTGIGVCRFNPKGGPLSGAMPDNQRIRDDGRQTTSESMFVLHHPNDDSKTGTVNALLEDSAGVIWAGAGRGLYRLEQTNGQWTLQVVDIGLAREVELDMRVRALVEDRQGALWIGAGSGLYRRWPDGRTERFTTEHGLPSNDVLTLALDTDGQLWVGTRKGVLQIALDAQTHQPRIIQVYTAKNGLSNANTRTIFQSSTGQLWVGSSTALVEFLPQSSRDDSQFRHYVSELVLSKLFVETLAEDRDGNLWIGTDNGALKLARNGFTTYTDADGLGESRVSSIFASRAGDLCAMTIFTSETPLSWFDGRQFQAIRPRLPRHLTYFGWGWHQLTLQDQAGEWWFPTGQGLVRYPKVGHVRQLATTPPKAVYTTRDGLVSNDVIRLYEDSHGDIWITTFTEAQVGLTRWERATEIFHHYGEADGLPHRTIPYTFTEDRAGNLWIGFSDSDFLARFRDGRFTIFTNEHGIPAGMIYNLHLDHRGRLWIASTTGGLARLDDTSAERPQFITYTTAQGLSSNGINCITEDVFGRLYLGTGRGLDRLDPETGRVKAFTAADGLVSGEVLVSFRDRKGDLWFGGKDGLSRLTPEPDPPQLPPPVLITGLRIAGETQQISALGETEMASLELAPSKNHIQIDFVGLAFGAGEALQYQYKLEGADTDWQPLTSLRTVNYGNLAAGNYRFLVRAINAEGLFSPTDASVAFTILSPIYLRWWFLALAALAAGGAITALYRYRINQLLKLERMRMRIASDLHDDIGSSLSQISIISEVVRAQLTRDNPAFAAPLSTIAQTSRELVDSMSDIVWAINPKRDNLRDLVHRMRRIATDTLTAQEIEFDFLAPDELPETRIDTDMRREIFLIFKEAVNNAARHARGSLVEIKLALDDGELQLLVEDDGCGFDTTRDHRGHGLVSMRQRAERIGGQLKITSTPGRGTEVILQAPLKTRRRNRL